MKNNTWTKGCDFGFKVGQKAWHSQWGWGEVIGIMDKQKHPIRWMRSDRALFNYMIDGCMHENDESPSLFHKEQTFDYGKPEWQPKPGELCWVWDDGDHAPMVLKYKNNEMGKFSFEPRVGISSLKWDNCAPFDGKLPDEFKHLEGGGK